MIERSLPLVILAVAGVYLSQAMQLPFGSTARPGPGFYPVLVGSFACLVALAATVQAFRAPLAVRALEETEADAPARRRRVVDTVAALAGFCLVLPWTGYTPVAFGFVTIVLRRLGSGWPLAVATGVLAALTSYVLFAVLLDVPLPRGPW